MPEGQWKELVILKEGDTLKWESSETAGFMGEEDIDTYSVLDGQGNKCGTVTVRDHTAVKGFRRTVRVTQVDISGVTIVERSYTEV